MRKVMTIVGTRPEVIKMSRVMCELDRHTRHVMVHTGQNFDYELNRVFFDELGVRQPDHYLDVAGSSVAQTVARIIERSDIIMEQEQPDALLLYGDTNSCLSVIPAKRRKIPVFHMEAGNRCFDQRVPEELNRKVVDHLSDVNLVLTEHARRYLLAEGIRPETIIKTGSHMCEVLANYRDNIQGSKVIETLKIEPRKYFLVSIHREENVDSVDNLGEILKTLNGLAVGYGFPVIVSTHPRTRNRLDALGSEVIDPRVRFLKPFGFFDYIKLQLEAVCVLSDSGSLTEEASLLNLRAIALRHTHERPEGMDRGTVVMAGLELEGVLEAVRLVLAQSHGGSRVVPEVTDYRNDAVSVQIVRIVLSYIDYVNRTVWRK